MCAEGAQYGNLLKSFDFITNINDSDAGPLAHTEGTQMHAYKFTQYAPLYCTYGVYTSSVISSSGVGI